MFSHTKKRVVGVVVGTCDKCSDTLPVAKRHNMWLCDSCNDVYKRSLSSPAEVVDVEKKRTRFRELVD